MTEDEKREFARRIIQDAAENIAFSDVYEEDDLEDASDEDIEEIHDLILSAKVSVSWDD